MRSGELWLQGLYNNNAFRVELENFEQAFSKRRRPPKRYVDHPLRVTPLTEQERKKKQEEDRKKVIAYFTNLQKRWERRN